MRSNGSLLSIARYLNQGQTVQPVHEDCNRAVQLLAQGIYHHAVEGRREDFEAFRNSMRELSEGVSGDLEPHGLLVLVGAILTLLSDHSRRATLHFRLQRDELMGMITVLTKGLAGVVASNTNSLGRLQEIERKLTTANEASDLRDLKKRLADCVGSMREEVEKSRLQSQAEFDLLKNCMDGARNLSRQYPPPDVDHITGLPGRRTCESELDLLSKENGPALVAVFVLNRLKQINARFGVEAGDEVLQYFATYVGTAMTGEDRLFRWTGPALVAVLRRNTSAPRVEQDIRRVVSTRLEHEIRLANRVVLLPITCSWATFKAPQPHQVLRQQIEEFIATRGEESHGNT